MQKTANHYFIQEHFQKKVFHGGMGNIDIETILLNKGFQPLVFPYYTEFTLKAKISRYIHVLKLLLTLPVGSVVFFQFPLYARMHELLIRMLAFRKSIKIICLIADIDGLKDGNAAVLQKEIDLLSRFTFFIVHGTPMERWLKKNVPHAITSQLHFFDFLATPADGSRLKSKVIAFAGNLIKSLFIEKLNLVADKHAITFNIYGPGATAAMMHQSHVHFKGVHDPYSLPGLIEGSFGLLWDGESIEGPGGNYGDYMQYITHHKLSLYVLAGLPVIVYAQAGSAEMVKQLNIGFTVSTLYEVGEQLERISEDAYQQMRANMKPLAERIALGANLKEAVDELLQRMK